MTDYTKQAFRITAPAVVLGDGSAATYLYRGGIVPAGFATDEQIEHHLAIKAIEKIDLPSAEDTGEDLGDASNPAGTDADGKPTALLDGKSFDEWKLDDLKADAKDKGVDLKGATAKADVYDLLVAQRAAQ
jgi:hypothetical protein